MNPRDYKYIILRVTASKVEKIDQHDGPCQSDVEHYIKETYLYDSNESERYVIVHLDNGNIATYEVRVSHNLRMVVDS